MTTDDHSPLPLHEQRMAGVCLHLTSLPGPHGIGTLGAPAHTFVDHCHDAGLRVWQFLPTGPTAFADSPYQPLSAFAGNPMLIDLNELVEHELLALDDLMPLSELPTDHVDYARLIPLKNAVLDIAAAQFFDQPNHALRSDYDAFIARHDEQWLDNYALFRTLKTLYDERPWYQWVAPYRQRDPDALAGIRRQRGEKLDAIKFVQWVFDRQWRALRQYAREHKVWLFGDMPIYIARDCADAWAQRELLRLDEDGTPDAVAGVPPDYFSEDGQLWGNPLYDWQQHSDTQYHWWVQRMRHTLTMVDIVRIDHFRGFEAFWSIPFGDDTARGGQWQSGPNDAVFDAMRAALTDLPVVAEDLGEITPAVVALRQRQGMPGMSVLQFLIGEDSFQLDQIARDSVAYTGTHDNDTTVGWFHGGPDDLRSDDQRRYDQQQLLAKTGGNEDAPHWALIRAAMDSAACMAMAPMQDFLGLGSEARMNIPGVTENNWRWRMLTDDFDKALRDAIRANIRQTRR
ncbi:MAG: 4-alpha-glucanotransferase [Pseudomonadota bacterium]